MFQKYYSRKCFFLICKVFLENINFTIISMKKKISGLVIKKTSGSKYNLDF